MGAVGSGQRPDRGRFATLETPPWWLRPSQRYWHMAREGRNLDAVFDAYVERFSKFAVRSYPSSETDAFVNLSAHLRFMGQHVNNGSLE